jgi:4,5-DOPA dioxygenase extradiol
MATTLTPALFIGHGSPENVVLNNAFTQSLQQLGQQLAKPRAILMISAHWLSRGSLLTTASAPEQIFDFHGFPDALYRVHYRPSTDASVIADILAAGNIIPITADAHAGFDHGTWTVLKHLFPDADVPVVQLSMDSGLSRQQHFALAQKLQSLRSKGIMVIGSGNIVHNLGRLDWHNRSGGYDWALRFDEQMKTALTSTDVDFITQPRTAMTNDGRLSVPTEDHYWPLLYVEGVRQPSDKLEWIYEGYEYGGISLRSYLLRS